MQNKDLSQTAFKAVRWTSLNTICQVGIQFLTLVILGRLLSPEAFGLMAMIMVVVELVNVFARMGLGEAIIYKKEVTQNELSSLYFLNIFVGLALFGLVFCSSGLISRMYSEPALVPLVRIISSLFFISSLGIIFEILLRKHLLFDAFSKINVSAHFIAFIFMVALAVQGTGVYSLVLGQVFLHMLKSALLILVASRKKWFPSLRFRISEIRFYLKFGIYRVLAMSANQLNSRVDQLLIGAILGPATLGFYNVAFRIIYLPIQKVNPILTQVAFPFFSKIQDDTPRLKRNYLKYINLILSINTPVLAGITAIAPSLVPLFLSEKWVPAVPIVQALAFYVFIRSIFNASGSLMMAKGKANWTFYWNMIMLFVIPSTTFAALKLSESVLGVCLALGAMFFIFFFFHYALFLRNLLGSFFKEYMLTIARPFVLSSSMGVLTYLLSIPLQNLPYAIAATCLIAFGATYYGLMTLFFNQRFVGELEKVLPGKLGCIVVKLRSKIRYSYVGL
jgi:O-antigen/teichoic acid export membrane protein